ncbi:MAG: carbonic anhydrase [Hyphomicrobiales bacterium]|nr:carbonic anhydrase [Hyphomicrobiales bacterium]
MCSAINSLIAGFKSFRAEYYEHRPERLRELSLHGQNPSVLMIACSDSRIDPAIVTRAEPGELFVVRNVANLVPPYEPDGRYHGTSAAIEFAVRDLRLSDIVIFGHSQCGGIQALSKAMAGEVPERTFLTPWVTLIRDKCADMLEAHPEDDDGSDSITERAAIRVSISNLLTFPWVHERVEQGTLTVHGWLFDLREGVLYGLDPATDAYVRLA